ncbi:hypothetical protein B0H14DRAFT_2370902, partial [Mycena olivaceomarginata]
MLLYINAGEAPGLSKGPIAVIQLSTPGIPRRDRSEVSARYCRLMLIFFKPWRHARDLRKEGESWENAFKSFQRTCSPSIQYCMDKMQILHECRDSRDD